MNAPVSVNAEIITIGDELLIGQVVNTNQAYIAERLNSIGIGVIRMTTVGDDMAPILRAFEEARGRADVVLVTGGLGPTHDDITKKAVCLFFKTELVRNRELHERIEALLRRRNAPWSAGAEEQALVPAAAELLPNPLGTAAGMVLRSDTTEFIVLPGVPYEMKAMMDQSVVQRLATRVKGSAIRHLTIRTAGIAESTLAQLIGNVDEVLEGQRLAFLPSPTGVRLRITVTGATPEAAEQTAKRIEERIRSRAPKYVIGTGDQDLETALGRILATRNLTIAVAESCTGGLIGHRITNVSGSSAYFERGVVAYSNKSKTETVGVDPSLIEKHGAVSREVAEAMAAGIRKKAGTSIGLSTTGIAGPTGGSPDKPVGLVWVGYSDAEATIALRFQFGNERSLVKERAAQAALDLVRRRVLKID